MIVPLIPPGVIDADAKLVVKMAVALETKYGQAESDPSFAVSDSNRFIGVLTTDKLNYASYSPCRGIEGDSGLTITKRNVDSPLPKPSESYYPGRFDIQLSLADRWGTCFVSLDGGFSREMIYQNKLNPKNGLFLEIYGDDAKEKEGIKYIELTILRENWHFLLLSWKEGKCLTQKFTVLVEIVLIKDAPWSHMLNQFTVLCVCVYFSLVPFHFET